MAPTRTEKPAQRRKNTAHNQGSFKEILVLPGVQKIKAALRQTRRLLAKEKLPADKRVETERRLKALEGELEQAEISRKEKALAVKYHKIKFFEKKKIIRKINQTKKSIASCDEEKSLKQLKGTLLGLRIELNYVQNYPKLKRYISLYPPEVRDPDNAPEVDPVESKRTNNEREQLKKQIAEQMANGELPTEPESIDEQSTSSKKSVNIFTPLLAVKSVKKKRVEATSEEKDAFFASDEEGGNDVADEDDDSS